MFEYPSLPRIMPLGGILFNFLFLLLAIPSEAYVLHARLKFDKKTSAFYAICINLFSNVIGWLVFFMVEPLLPVQIKSELINYIFFNRFQSERIETLLVLIAFIIFFTTFLVKFFFLRVLLITLSEPGKNDKNALPPIRRNSRRNYKFKLQNTNVVTSVLIANSFSYSLIVFMLFIRSVSL